MDTYYSLRHVSEFMRQMCTGRQKLQLHWGPQKSLSFRVAFTQTLFNVQCFYSSRPGDLLYEVYNTKSYSPCHSNLLSIITRELL